MSLQRFDGTMGYAIDTATRKLHLVTVGYDEYGGETVTDLGAVIHDTDIALANATIDVGEMGILNAANTQINPAKEDGNLAAILTALQTANGNGLTFSCVAIAQGATAGTTHLKAAVTSNYLRLHALIGTVAAAGTVTIQDTSSTPVVMVGGMTFAQNGGCVIPFNADARACTVTTVGKGIDLVTSGMGCGFNGYAIVSQATS